jgi:serine/threonine-protein kinase
VSSPIREGELVAGKYRVDRVLGEGGMGVVVAATHEQLDQRVALKFLLPSLAANQEVLQRFVREARAAVRIHSEHVARVLDVGTHEGTPFMVMEYLEGEDLAQVLAARGRLPAAEAVGFLLQACEAIAEAHAQGMVHRDLKPANLFLARRPTGKPMVKVLDFGISKVAPTAKDAAITSTTAMMGSPSYMSPEQLLSANTVDARADIWSMGVVLYELLAARLPFAAETMPELVAMVLQRGPDPLRERAPEVPPALVAIVERCLQKERDARFANVAALARALAPFGPPRSEQSVERVEHLLGVEPGPPSTAPLGAGTTTSPGAASPGPQQAGAHATTYPSTPPMPAAPPMPRVEGMTFIPTTSQPPRTPDRRWILLPVAGALLGAVAVVVIFRPHGRIASQRGPASTATVVSTSSGPASASTASVATGTESPSAVATLVAIAPNSPIPSASAAPSGAASAADAKPPASATLPAWATARVPTKGAAGAHATASAAAPAPTPTCHIASYFDADGNKHFKQECP